MPGWMDYFRQHPVSEVNFNMSSLQPSAAQTISNSVKDIADRTNDMNSGFWDNYLTGFGNYFTKNPLQPLNLGYGIWSSINDYKMQKQNYNLARDAYNFQKQMAENNEARNQERFNWLRDARATSQL